jgi:hypothetical protein
MSRVVNTNNPGKRRSQNLRACAELLRHLSQKAEIDDEAKDMLAAMVFALREVEKSLDEAVVAWEKRDYWIKAEQFRQKWTWTGLALDTLVDILKTENWAALPMFMVKNLPYFADIKINRVTRQASLWEGKYEQLSQEWA